MPAADDDDPRLTLLRLLLATVEQVAAGRVGWRDAARRSAAQLALLADEPEPVRSAEFSVPPLGEPEPCRCREPAGGLFEGSGAGSG